MAKVTAETLATIREQKRKADEAYRLARKLSGESVGISIDEKRHRDRERKSGERAAKSVIIIPSPADPERRKRLEADPHAWLLHYFGPGCGLADPFTYQFTPQQCEMIESIEKAIKHGGDQSLALSRGEGKTTVARRLTIKGVLTGAVNYVVIFASTGPMAETILDGIDTDLTDNQLLREDYPEVCLPVLELEGAPQRANTQRANGVRLDDGKAFEMARLDYRWCGSELIFPKVPGSPSAGAIIATRGLDAAVRGLNKRGKRPQLAIIDDPDTEHTAASEEQAAKLAKRIDAAIGGLGGQRRPIGRVMLTTIQSRISASYIYTDPAKKSTFKGRRYRFLVKPPEALDMWDEYVSMRLEDLQRRDENGIDLDEFARRSHAFYISNRDKMDAGAIVSNPNRFIDRALPDGSQEEASALQHYFNLVARLGPENVRTEYDNDPPELDQHVDSGLAPTRIQRQVSGYDRRIVPPECVCITQGIDVRKVALHWVVRAWRQDGTGFVIDYGVHEVHGTTYGSDEGLDEAVRKAILSRMEATRTAEYIGTDGELREVDLTLVDAGWRTDAVYAACHQVGLGIMPVMGFGKSSGCTQANFTEYQRRTPDKKPGDRWFLSRKSRLWLVAADADHWKSYEHDRWLTSPERPGSLRMFGIAADDKGGRMSDDEKSHHAYARHICNEAEIEEMKGGVLRRRWRAKSENTHWLDASYYANVAASIKGIRLAHTAPSKATPNTTINTAAEAPSSQQPAKAPGQATQATMAANWYQQSRRIRTR